MDGEGIPFPRNNGAVSIKKNTPGVIAFYPNGIIFVLSGLPIDRYSGNNSKNTSARITLYPSWIIFVKDICAN